MKRMIFLVMFPIAALAGSPEPKVDCGPGRHWVRAHPRRAFIRGNGSHVRASHVTAHCQDNSGSYAEWSPKLKDGRPRFWMFKLEKSADWTDEEREWLIEALDETPDLLKNQGIEGIYRMHTASNPDNPAASHGDDIVLYDNIFDRYVLTHVLDHELAHRVYDSMSPSEKKRFLQDAGWRTDDQGAIIGHRPDDQFLRKNGTLSPVEDFADDATIYVHQPGKLKKTAPNVYDWMEKNLRPKLKKRDSK